MRVVRYRVERKQSRGQTRTSNVEVLVLEGGTEAYVRKAGTHDDPTGADLRTAAWCVGLPHYMSIPQIVVWFKRSAIEAYKAGRLPSWTSVESLDIGSGLKPSMEADLLSTLLEMPQSYGSNRLQAIQSAMGLDFDDAALVFTVIDAFIPDPSNEIQLSKAKWLAEVTLPLLVEAFEFLLNESAVESDQRATIEFNDVAEEESEGGVPLLLKDLSKGDQFQLLPSSGFTYEVLGDCGFSNVLVKDISTGAEDPFSALEEVMKVEQQEVGLESLVVPAESLKTGDRFRLTEENRVDSVLKVVELKMGLVIAEDVYTGEEWMFSSNTPTIKEE